MNKGTLIPVFFLFFKFLIRKNISRPDRDSYVTINYTNMIKYNEGEFYKFPTTAVTTYNIPYDYASTMHYNGYVS